ncbi:MAG TPA: ABC transporter permease [Tenuifilaceae bacterium]|nr:ABC transporter permease [Tenuifilaceae bacterium]HPE17989.1 ABC transporter permease [Tenuifilaceae bacterium]HPJ44891.1 ABC transporter permease [Tenuifilaceae bacterium]HPQ33143.1 ABC transporter permease [Tenuifilaceae bacterium]HRX67076.1 ABC transporter permease [Tenuifilaceae bacterium]
MLQYLTKRFLYSILIIWGVVTLVFTLFNLIPGDPARMVMGQRTDEASLAAIRHDLGLDKPTFYQYLKYINDISPVSIHNPKSEGSYIYLNQQVYQVAFKLNFTPSRCLVLKAPYLRRSYQSGKSISTIIGETLPNTFILAFTSMAFATILGIGFGVISALTKDSWLDRIILVLSAFGMSIPSFFAAILFGWLFAYVLGDFTGLNLTGNIWEIDNYGEGIKLQIKNLILPAFTLGIRPLSVVTQLARSSMLETLSQDYIRTARSKGLSFPKIIWNHALKNSMNPVVSAISGWFASLMAGVIFIEYIFGWKGLGNVMVNALNSYDIPLVLGSVITISAVFVVINLLVDVTYGFLDPRIRIS